MSKDDLHSIEVAATATEDARGRRSNAEYELLRSVISAYGEGASTQEVMQACHNFIPMDENDWTPWGKSRSAEDQFAGYLSGIINRLVRDSS